MPHKDIDPTAILKVAHAKSGTIKAVTNNGKTIQCLLLRLTGTLNCQPASYDVAIPASDVDTFIALIQEAMQRTSTS